MLSQRNRVIAAMIVAILIMFVFFISKTLTTFNLVDNSGWKFYDYFEYGCFVLFCLPAGYLIKDFLHRKNVAKEKADYIEKLNSTQIKYSHNEIFFAGNVEAGSAVIVKGVSDTMSADRCSLWLYSKDKSSIVCTNLYIKAEGKFYQNIELFEKDFAPYFAALETNPIIIADNAETHPATSCFLDGYLKPLGVKSMLDVPVWYKGSVIGVICIESLTPRVWQTEEVDFAQMLSSVFSFGYSVKESNKLSKQMSEMESFLDSSAIITKADKHGKITYVNEQFSKVSGYSLEEVIGKNHNIVNSGTHPKEFWADMYRTTVKEKGIWNAICTNRTKDGSLYYVDTFIKCDFDEEGKLTGFMSIRQDVTELKKKELEIRNRMNAINKSNAVIEFDLDGRVVFANDLFLETMGYSTIEEVVGKHHSIFIEDQYEKSKDYETFWEVLRGGTLFSGEITRVKKDGSLIYLQATYNPIIGNDGKVYRIMKIATDVTDSHMQSIIIEKKNTYLEHAAKILRHDMHSGINTYMPRGLSSLERRMSDEHAKELKIDAPLRMIKEGLRHTQKVYKGVYEFTNLVKKDVVLNRTDCNLKDILEDYLSATAYRPQVEIDDIGILSVNEALFCTAVDNIIRNGLKYNDSAKKSIKIYRIDNAIYVEDNGRGLSAEEFKYLSQPYTRKEGQKESGTGLGLNICIAILEEHGFTIECDKLSQGGTQMKITI